MKRMAFLIAGIACCSSAFAGEFVVPLSGLNGYYTNGTTRTITFNAGHSFTLIRSVRLVIAGTHSLGWWGGVECPLHQDSLMYRAAMGPNSATSSCCWFSNGELDQYRADLYEDVPLRYPTYPWCPPENLNFLLDGTDEISLSFTHSQSFCTLLVSGSATVGVARLIIDGETAGVHLINPQAGQLLLGGDSLSDSMARLSGLYLSGQLSASVQ